MRAAVLWSGKAEHLQGDRLKFAAKIHLPNQSEAPGLPYLAAGHGLPSCPFAPVVLDLGV